MKDLESEDTKMIKSLELGYIWGVEAKIEIIESRNKKEILLERVQSEPFYHNNETAFTLDGQLLRILKIEDILIPQRGHHGSGVLVLCQSCPNILQIKSLIFPMFCLLSKYSVYKP